MAQDFIEWVESLLKEKEWPRVAISKRGGISAPYVTRVLNREQNPGQDFYKAIADTFNIPLETVYREAGRLPQKTDRDQLIDEIEHIYGQLDEPGRTDLVEYARLRMKIQEERSRYNAKTPPPILEQR